MSISTVQSDLIFNYIGLAFAKDNDGENPTFTDCEETKLAKKLLSEVLGISEEQITEEFQNRL